MQGTEEIEKRNLFREMHEKVFSFVGISPAEQEKRLQQIEKDFFKFVDRKIKQDKDYLAKRSYAEITQGYLFLNCKFFVSVLFKI